MMKIMKITFKITCLFVVVALTGCAEASFELGDTSSARQIFPVSESLTDDQVDITLDYYTYGSAKIRLFIDGKLSSTIKMKLMNSYPLTLGKDRYPSYSLLKDDARVVCVEHRAMEPQFYICDKTAELLQLLQEL